MKPSHKKRIKFIGDVLLVVIPLLCLLSWIIPVSEFQDPASSVLEARNGELLAARIAADGQWRFPLLDSIPRKFEACLLDFEDRKFYWHPGVDPEAIVRAAVANIKAGRIEQGASTLTMQVARMIGGRTNRSFGNKLKELILSFHLELNLSKEDILLTYCSNAPFGGNVVGLEAASWRYYGRDPYELSWSESATLAVLPNAPSLHKHQ